MWWLFLEKNLDSERVFNRESTKIAFLPNYKQKQLHEPIRIRNSNTSLTQRAGKLTCASTNSFACHWWRTWREIFKPIATTVLRQCSASQLKGMVLRNLSSTTATPTKTSPQNIT